MASRHKKDHCLYKATGLVIYKLDHSNPLYITPDFIRSVHRELYSYYRPAAGNYRNCVYRAIIKSKTFTPVPPGDIVSMLLDLCEFVNNKNLKRAYYKKYFTSKLKGYSKLDNKLKKLFYGVFCASYVHHQITYIHPFTGGNGRLARLMMSMELANHNFYTATFPPLLNFVIKSKRERYLNALSSCDKGNYLEFCIFLAEVIHEASIIERAARKKRSRVS